mmetsp:Transcript_43848/g.137759  ORF Transcript_43848/g.137759 Transcript_43848/m.137759 type:complete len:280 (+) Transcript_43848:123-962(+)
MKSQPTRKRTLSTTHCTAPGTLVLAKFSTKGKVGGKTGVRLGLVGVLAAHELLEALDLGLGAVGHLGAVLGAHDRDLEHGLLAIGGLAAGLLDEVADRSDLVENAQLGLGGRGDRVHEDALALDHDLVHVRHHAAGVAELVLLLEPVVKELLVAGVVLGGAEVARGEELALGDGLEGVGLDPLAVAAREVVDEEELVGARDAIHGHGHGGTRAVHAHAGALELLAGDAGELGARPHAEDGAHSEVSVDDGAAVERVEGNGVALAAHGVLHLQRIGGWMG